MARAKLPLDQNAVKKANDKLYSNHENDPRPNHLFDADGNRKPLDPNNSEQSELRSEWMDNYSAAGGTVTQEKATPAAQPVKQCSDGHHYIEVKVNYDDHWETACSDVPLRAKVNGQVVFEGAKTKSLTSLHGGGLLEADTSKSKDELGSYHHKGVPSGSAEVEIVAEEVSEEEIKDLEQKIDTGLTKMSEAIQQAVKPWADEWHQDDGWMHRARLLYDARDRGMMRGMVAWKDDQVDTWNMITHVAGKAKDGAVEIAEAFDEWYEHLTFLEKTFLPITIANKGAEFVSAEVEKLWEKRDQILKLFKAFAEGSVNAIEKAIDALIDMGGEVGELMKLLKEKGNDWVQALIEVCRETPVIPKIFSSVALMIMSIPPTLWVEGYSTAAGYILLEVLVAIIMIIITYLSSGAGASLLAARIASYTRKVFSLAKKLGNIGEVFLKMFRWLEKIGDDIYKLVRLLWRKIAEKVEAGVDKINKVSRKIAKRLKTRIVDFKLANGSMTKVAKREDVIVQLDKVQKYARGKSPDVSDELRTLQKFKQQNRKAFDANPENQKLLDALKGKKHNFDRSVDLGKKLESIGLKDTARNNRKLVEHLLDVGETVTPENRLWVPSVFNGPSGQIKVESTWKILENGDKYLTTLKLIPMG